MLLLLNQVAIKAAAAQVWINFMLLVHMKYKDGAYAYTLGTPRGEF